MTRRFGPPFPKAELLGGQHLETHSFYGMNEK